MVYTPGPVLTIIIVIIVSKFNDFVERENNINIDKNIDLASLSEDGLRKFEGRDRQLSEDDIDI
jgi:hypothetical protein